VNRTVYVREISIPPKWCLLDRACCVVDDMPGTPWAHSDRCARAHKETK
jgi:hypothetical protein